MNKRLLALWICVAYFAVLFLMNIVPAMWGTLGIIRPGDAPGGKIEADRALALIMNFARPLQHLTLLVGLGAVSLSVVALSLSKSASRVQSKRDREDIP